MATRKKKTEGIVLDMPGTIGGAKIVHVEPANKPSRGWPKMKQGTHLTVKTFEDGHTELIWDDEQLLKEVREAIASVEKPKKTTKGKKNVSTQ